MSQILGRLIDQSIEIDGYLNKVHFLSVNFYIHFDKMFQFQADLN